MWDQQWQRFTIDRGHYFDVNFAQSLRYRPGLLAGLWIWLVVVSLAVLVLVGGRSLAPNQPPVADVL